MSYYIVWSLISNSSLSSTSTSCTRCPPSRSVPASTWPWPSLWRDTSPCVGLTSTGRSPVLLWPTWPDLSCRTISQTMSNTKRLLVYIIPVTSISFALNIPKVSFSSSLEKVWITYLILFDLNLSSSQLNDTFYQDPISIKTSLSSGCWTNLLQLTSQNIWINK